MLTDGGEQEEGEVRERWYRLRHAVCGGVAAWYMSGSVPLPGTRIMFEGFRLCDGTRPERASPAICGHCGERISVWSSGMFEEVDPLTAAITVTRWETAATPPPCSTTPPPEDLPTATAAPTTPEAWSSSHTQEMDPPADQSAS